MPVEVIIAGVNALAGLLLLALALMRAWPQVVIAAPVPRHPCGFVPSL
jgi:hypothetical protein